MPIRRVCIALVAGFCWTSSAAGQNLEPPIPIPRLQNEFGGVIDLEAKAFARSTSISTQVINGVKTTKVDDNGLRLLITDDPASGITCKVTRHYGPEDREQLEKDHPELFMHLSAIPNRVDESTVEVSVDVTSTYTAADPKELEEQHPEVFELYEKYSKNRNQGFQMNLNGIRPMRIRVDPRGQPVIEDVQPDRQDNPEDDNGHEPLPGKAGGK